MAFSLPDVPDPRARLLASEPSSWLENIDEARTALWPVLESTYGKDFAKVWFMRWRMFFLAVSELFGYDDGREWYVGHYLFSKKVY